MAIKQPVIAIAAAALFLGSSAVPVLAQDGCSFMYQRVMEAYQMQSPRYGQMLNHYNERCLSGSSGQPAWGGNSWGGNYGHHRYDYDRRGGYENYRQGGYGYDHDRSRWGW